MLSNRAATLTPSPKMSSPSHNHVAKIDADAEFDAAVLRHPGIAIAHPALNFRRAGDRVHDAWKFHQHAVAGQLDDASLMLADFADR